MQTLAAPSGAQGAALCWLFAALVWFSPVVSGMSGPQQSLSGFLWVCISPALVAAALLRKWLSFCTQTGNPMGQEAPPVLRV